MKFIGLRDIANVVIDTLEELKPTSFYEEYPLKKWKMSDGFEDVGEVNEVVQFIEDDKVYTCLEFKYFDHEEKPIYVFEWENTEV